MPLIISAGTDPSGAALVNMTIAAGESVQAAVTIANNGAPLNLAGYELKMQIDFVSPVTLSTLNGGITITDASAGQAQINITDSASTEYIAGSYAQEFWAINGTFAMRLWVGTFTVLKSITSIP